MCDAIDRLDRYREPEALKIDVKKFLANMKKNQISHESTMLKEKYFHDFEPKKMVHNNLAEYLIVDLNIGSENCVHIGMFSVVIAT